MQCLLWPLACIYDAVTALRNVAFSRGWIHSQEFPCATIAIGNLAVGGTGKTPHAEYLLRLLSPHHATALLSRGYGRKTHGFLMAGKSSTAAEIGDEPLQMHLKFPHVSVAVDENRCEGLWLLLSMKQPPEVVILDDAFQHRYVRAGLYLLLTDYHRLYSSDFVLPAGRLRESKRGAKRAQIVLVTKCPKNLSLKEQQDIARKLKLQENQRLFFTTWKYGTPYGLFSEKEKTQKNKEALVITGIAHPEPLYEHLSKKGYDIKPLRFPDHHAFTDASAAIINRTYEEMAEGSAVFTTEKDAVRFRLIKSKLSTSLREALQVQPIEVAFVENDEEETNQKEFNQTIYNYVTSYQTNSRVD